MLETDADRERFGVKRRFEMRDGERFFAEGSDNANYELRQQQMKRAGDWRIGMRHQVLQNLSGLGRHAQMFQQQTGAMNSSRSRFEDEMRPIAMPSPGFSGAMNEWGGDRPYKLGAGTVTFGGVNWYLGDTWFDGGKAESPPSLDPNGGGQAGIGGSGGGGEGFGYSDDVAALHDRRREMEPGFEESASEAGFSMSIAAGLQASDKDLLNADGVSLGMPMRRPQQFSLELRDSESFDNKAEISAPEL